MSILPCWEILEGEYLSTLGYPSTDCRIHGGVRRQRFDGPPSWDMFVILILIISNDKISPKSWREVTIVGLKVVNVLALVGRLDQVAGVGQMRHGAANRLFSYVIPTSNVIDNLAGRTSYQSLLVGCYRYISPMFNIFTTNTVVYLCIRYCNFKNESRFSQIWMTKQIYLKDRFNFQIPQGLNCCSQRIMSAAREFLLSVLPSQGIEKFDREGERIPSVTLTFAQSLDGKIAGSERRQLTLSGADSMLMTHWYRRPSMDETN